MRSVSEATTVEARDEGTSEADITSPEDHAVPLTDNALKVLKRRYLRKDEGGRVIETPEQMFRRVSKAVAAADQLYNLSTDNSKIETEFYNMMSRLEFLPNSPTLMNAGTELGQLSRELRAVGGIHRVLVLELCNQQREKVVLAQGRALGDRRLLAWDGIRNSYGINSAHLSSSSLYLVCFNCPLVR